MTAPVLDTTEILALGAQSVTAGTPSGSVGTLVSSLVDLAVPLGQKDNVSDSDSNAIAGIAITSVDHANGTWWYTTDGGANWLVVGSVTDGSARLLAADASTRIYFQPNLGFGGTIANAITIRAWDQSSGTNGTLADTSVNGGSTAFSTATDTASIFVNDAARPGQHRQLDAGHHHRGRNLQLRQYRRSDPGQRRNQSDHRREYWRDGRHRRHVAYQRQWHLAVLDQRRLLVVVDRNRVHVVGICCCATPIAFASCPTR